LTPFFAFFATPFSPVHDQHREIAFCNEMLRDAAEYELAKAATSVRAREQQVGPFGGGGFHECPPRIGAVDELRSGGDSVEFKVTNHVLARRPTASFLTDS